MARVTIPDIQAMHRSGQKIVMMTAYDYETARIVDRAGADMILVGDSGSRYALGSPELSVTVDEMLLLTRSVRRGAERSLVVGDLPFLSYQINHDEAVRNAGRFVKEAGADAVKLEGGEEFAPVVHAIVRAGIPVVGHMGLTPQTAIGVGGYLNPNAGPPEEQVRRDAFALQQAGVCALVFTRVPPALAATLTQELSVPTLAGGGSGDACSGQVCVIHSVFGMSADDIDRPEGAYGPLARTLYDTAQRFIGDVRAGKAVRSQREAVPAAAG
jgi:3-methyl-2-oxobutanoate hydroxymethyltransferase